MSAKRGVTRLFVVLWALWAVLGLVVVANHYYQVRQLEVEAQKPEQTRFGDLMPLKQQNARKAREGLPLDWALWGFALPPPLCCSSRFVGRGRGSRGTPHARKDAQTRVEISDQKSSPKEIQILDAKGANGMACSAVASAPTRDLRRVAPPTRPMPSSAAHG